MFDLSTIKHMNSPRVSVKILDAAIKFNTASGHAKSSEKYSIAITPAEWTTDAQWEARKKRRRARKSSY